MKPLYSPSSRTASATRSESLVTSEDELREALQESLKLQAHYARLLNDYDGGHRKIFDSVDAWLRRLRAMRANK